MNTIPTQTLPTWAQISALSAQLCLGAAQSNTIRETDGDNCSPEIDKIERVFGLARASYCEMGADFERLKALIYQVWPNTPIDDALLQKAKVLYEQQYGPLLVGCADTIAAYTPRRRWRALGGMTRAWISALRPGDGIIYDFSTPGNVDRHFETFLKMQTNPDGSLYKNDNGCFVMVTVGFNTVPDAESGDLGSGDQGNGQGCYVRHRPVNGTVMGSVDYNTERP